MKFLSFIGPICALSALSEGRMTAVKLLRTPVFALVLVAVALSVATGFSLATTASRAAALGSGNAPLAARSVDGPTVFRLTVQPFVSLDSETGIATVSGTIRCVGGQSFVGGSLTQQTGDSVIEGFFSVNDSSLCDGTLRTWTAEVSPVEGQFTEGRAIVSVEGASCGILFCDSAQVERTVRLRH
jgi:hypothetical protein